MPPCTIDLEDWWLSRRNQVSTFLLDPRHLGIKSEECGFSQAVQQRLRSFDNNQTMQAELRSRMLEISAQKAFDCGHSPRAGLHEATRLIFRRPDAGGVDFSRALHGLDCIDAMETHRLRVLSATRLAMASGLSEVGHSHLIEELHRQATIRYKHCHMGLRATVSSSTSFTMTRIQSSDS